MLEGRCLKCGRHYFGWALLWPQHQMCTQCGVGLQIKDGETIVTGYSPFSAKKYSITPPNGLPISPDKVNNRPDSG